MVEKTEGSTFSSAFSIWIFVYYHISMSPALKILLIRSPNNLITSLTTLRSAQLLYKSWEALSCLWSDAPQKLPRSPKIEPTFVRQIEK